jgi:hypothetical protein
MWASACTILSDAQSLQGYGKLRLRTVQNLIRDRNFRETGRSVTLDRHGVRRIRSALQMRRVKNRQRHWCGNKKGGGSCFRKRQCAASPVRYRDDAGEGNLLPRDAPGWLLRHNQPSSSHYKRFGFRVVQLSISVRFALPFLHNNTLFFFALPKVSIATSAFNVICGWANIKRCDQRPRRSVEGLKRL